MKRVPWLVALCMVLFALARFAPVEQYNLELALLNQTAAYLLVIVLYATLPSLVIERRFAWFAAIAIIGLSLASLVSVTEGIIEVTLVVGTVVVVSALVGHLRERTVPLSYVLFCGGGLVLIGSLLWLLPNLDAMSGSLKEMLSLTLSSVEAGLRQSSPDQATGEAVGRELAMLGEAIVRLLPASTVLSACAQFAIGTLIFLNRSARIGIGETVPEFTRWRVPFWMTSGVVVLVLGRLLGGEDMTYWADNGIAVLSVLYSIGGLAVTEYFMRAFRFAWFLKFGVYLLLFFSGLVGYGMLGFVGFVDSFVDWRARAEASKELAK